jgi:hypothetical protein
MKILFLISFFYSFSALAEIKVVDDKIHIIHDVNFEKKLEIQNFEKGGKEAFLKETGFIIASAQSTYENDHFVAKWVALHDTILKENDINLSNIPAQKGLAYGVISTSEDFEEQLKLGQEVLIKRYGLPSDHFIGKITRIVKKGKHDIVQVHFTAQHADELIAGTTCEVQITHIKLAPLKVSLLSLLHLGLEDYIVIKDGPGVYSAKHATILDQDAQTATVILPLGNHLQYVARGAILLKPVLNLILKPKR